MKMRLQKFLADAGLASRRKSETLIVAGKIRVNGIVVDKLGTQIDEAKDVIECGGKIIGKQEDMVYIALNKPEGYISSATSAQGKSVMELVRIPERVYPVGRLDKDSCGLILLTNDGELTNLLTHPKFEMEREYLVYLDRKLTSVDAKELERGIMVEGKLMSVHKVLEMHSSSPLQGEVRRGSIVRLILKEGANRQIRKMLGRLGYSMAKLQRIRIGKLELGTIPEGFWQEIRKEDII